MKNAPKAQRSMYAAIPLFLALLLPLASDAGTAITQKAYKTISAGLAETKAGDHFLVVQNGGEGAYRYTHTNDGADFEGVVLFGPNAESRMAQRSEEAKAPAPVAGLLAHLWGTKAREWDGRVIPNEVAATTPTLNLLPDPFNPTNESGSQIPSRELNTHSTTDPLGGSNALQLTFTAPNQQLLLSQGAEGGVKGPWETPIGSPLRCRLWAKSLSGSKNYSFCTPASKVELTSDWAEYRLDFKPNSSTGIGLGSGSDNSSGVAAIAGAAIYDEFAGQNLPDLQKLLQDQCSAHGTMPLKVPGAIRFTPEGAIDNAAMGAGVRIFTGPDLPEAPEYTLGVWVSPDEIENPSYGTAITIGDHLDKSAKYFHGMLGIYSDKNTSISDRGRLRPFPTNNVGSKRTGQYLIGQGWQHLAITIKNGITTPYINGIPIYEAKDASWKTPRFNSLTIGYYMPNLKRQNSNRYLPGRWQGAYIARKALSDGEILQMDRHGRARLKITGIAPAARRVVAFGMGGGEIAKPESWWWHLCENYNLSPRLHGHLEAQTAGGVAAWASPERLAFITRQILSAADSYDEVWCFVPSGGTDETIWAANGYKFDAYKTQYLDYLQKLRAINPKVRIAVATALPRARADAPIKIEQARQAWNDHLRASYAEMGIDRLFDIGLGTERLDPEGGITVEKTPGGSIMGNWRVASASRAHQRKPAAALNLSSTAGDSITATTSAGIFAQDDVYRRVVTANGNAQITSVSKDGAQATLSTIGYTPKQYNREKPDQLTRDSIVRTEFSRTSLPQDEWSIESDSSYYNNGTDQTSAGGRILGDLLAPAVQQMIKTP